MIEEVIQDKDYEALNNIKRWCLNRVQREENIAEHSFWVMFIVDILLEELDFRGNAEQIMNLKLSVLRHTLYHDIDEMFTGDVDNRVKNNPFNGEAIKKVLKEYAETRMIQKFSDKNHWGQTVLNNTLGKNDFLYTLVKIADWLSFIKFSHTEVALGSADFLDVLDHCETGLRKSIPKAIEGLKEYCSDKDISFSDTILTELLNVNFKNDR